MVRNELIAFVGVRKRLGGAVIEEDIGVIAIGIDLRVVINRSIARRVIFGHLNTKLARKTVRKLVPYLCEQESRMRATARW